MPLLCLEGSRSILEHRYCNAIIIVQPPRYRTSKYFLYHSNKTIPHFQHDRAVFRDSRRHFFLAALEESHTSTKRSGSGFRELLFNRVLFSGLSSGPLARRFVFHFMTWLIWRTIGKSWLDILNGFVEESSFMALQWPRRSSENTEWDSRRAFLNQKADSA